MRNVENVEKFSLILKVQFSFGDMLSSHFVSSLRSENVFLLFVLGCCCRSQSVEIEEKRTPKNILTILFFSLWHRPRWWHDRNDECFSVAQQSENEANCAENGPRGEDPSGMGKKKSHLIFIKKKLLFLALRYPCLPFSHFTLQLTSARAATTIMIRWWMMSSTCDNEVYRRRVNSSSAFVLFFSTLRSSLSSFCHDGFHDKSLDWPRHFAGESVVTTDNIACLSPLI